MSEPLGRRWPVPALVTALSLTLFALPLAFDVPLLDPDEGLHASIAREMVERGEWVTPTFLGEPFLDKPILYFWTQVVSLRLLGFTEQAVRLPGLLFGWLGALTTGLVAARLLGTRGGVLAGVAYATMFFPLGLAQAAVHDIALVPFVNLAVLALLPLADDPDRRGAIRTGVQAGAWLGCSVLTKGLAGIAFAGIAVAPLIVSRRGLRAKLVAAGATMLAVAAAVAAPWYFAMEAAHPGYLDYYFLQRHVGGYAAGTERHSDAPWWYYGPVLLGGGMPWIAFVPAAMRVALRRGTPAAAAAVALATAWLAGGFIFVSLGSAKLSTYLLPVFPAVALLAAVAWRPCTEAQPPPETAARWVGVGTWTACLVSGAGVAAAIAFAARTYGTSLDGWPRVLVGAVVASWALPAALWRARRPRASFAAVAACTAATLLAGLGAMPGLASRFSDRELARHYNRLGQLPAQVLFVDQRIGSFPFYLSPALRADLSPSRVRRVTPAEAFAMRGTPRGTVFVLSLRRAGRLAAFVDWERMPAEQVGDHVLVAADALLAALRAGRPVVPRVP